VRATVVILTKLPGHLPVKSRLIPLLGKQGAIEFHLDSLRRTIELARRFDAEPTVATSPFDADPAAALPHMPPCRLMPIAGENGGICLENALALAEAGAPLIALGADAPDLPASRIEKALDMLRWFDAAMVPTRDGGFSCLALREPVTGLAGGFDYGGSDAYESLCLWLDRKGLTVAQLDPWDDIDTPEDYEDYLARSTSDD
jgi:glycosyltransferase A (GT-A) superfamily protein (DUF2064 family)